MEAIMSRSFGLTKHLSQLFDLDTKVDTVLSVSMYYLNQYMDSERSSIFLFQHWNQRLTIFSSLDLEKHEVCIPKACGVAGWVFGNRQPAIVNNAYRDSRFCAEVDELTGFQTRNLICVPLVDSRGNCIGTLQSLNKKVGGFNTDDLNLITLAADMLAIAIKNSERYCEVLVTNEARRKFIERITETIA